MVTAILVFMFVSPHFINYNDKPVETVALHASEVLVQGGRHLRTEAAASCIRFAPMTWAAATTDAERRAAILRVIEPISGEVTLERYEPVRDAQGKVVAYNAWVLR